MFTDLKPGTAYVFEQRYAAVGGFDASPASEKAWFRTYRPVAVYDIDVAPATGGRVGASLTNASAGTRVYLSAITYSGYRLLYFTVDGRPLRGDSFIMPAHDVTVSAVFAGTFPFIDVPAYSWYRGSVEFVYFRGLMDGTSSVTFEPDARMTRAMVWAILARMDGQRISGVNWQSAARAWAMNEGVSDGTDPNGLVTREQFATMLWRFAGSPSSSRSLAGFSDAGSVSDWAETAMRWAVEEGIVNGVSPTTLVPQGSATRAQAAAMLTRFVK